MSDLLKMDYINSLPQPFLFRFVGGSTWPVNDIDVETGCLRIDVCGKLEVKHFGDVVEITDGNFQKHDPETWYTDFEAEYAD